MYLLSSQSLIAQMRITDLKSASKGQHIENVLEYNGGIYYLFERDGSERNACSRDIFFLDASAEEGEIVGNIPNSIGYGAFHLFRDTVFYIEAVINRQIEFWQVGHKPNSIDFRFSVATPEGYFMSVGEDLFVIENNNVPHKFDFENRSFSKITLSGYVPISKGYPIVTADFMALPADKLGQNETYLLTYKAGGDSLEQIVEINPETFHIVPGESSGRYFIVDEGSIITSTDGTQNGTYMYADLSDAGLAIEDAQKVGSKLIVKGSNGGSASSYYMYTIDSSGGQLVFEEYVTEIEEIAKASQLYGLDQNIFFIHQQDEVVKFSKWNLISGEVSKRFETVIDTSLSGLGVRFEYVDLQQFVIRVSHDVRMPQYWHYDLRADSLVYMYQDGKFLSPGFFYDSDPAFYQLDTKLLFHRYTEEEGSAWWALNEDRLTRYISGTSNSKFGAFYIDLDYADEQLYIFSSGTKNGSSLHKYNVVNGNVNQIGTLLPTPFNLPAIALSQFKQGNLYFTHVDHFHYPSITYLTKYSPLQNTMTNIFEGREDFYQMWGEYDNGHTFADTDKYLYFLSLHGKVDDRLYRVDSLDQVMQIFTTIDSVSKILAMSTIGADLYFLARGGNGVVEFSKVSDDKEIAEPLELFEAGSTSIYDQIKVFNNELYFTVRTNTGNEVWWSDGSVDGTKQLGIPSATEFAIISDSDRILVVAPLPGNRGFRIYKINSDKSVSEFVSNVAYGGQLIQKAFYFKSNLVIPIQQGLMRTWKLILLDTSDFQMGLDGPLEMFYTKDDVVTTENHIWYSRGNGTGGDLELWHYDGHEAKLVADMHPGCGSSFPRDFYTTKTHFFFSADDGTHGRQMYSIDLDEITSVGEVHQDLSRFDFQMTPNPAADRVSLHFENLRNIQLNIVDLRGRVLQHHDINRPNFVLSLSDLSTGLYLISAADGKRVITKKLIVY